MSQDKRKPHRSTDETIALIKDLNDSKNKALEKALNRLKMEGITYPHYDMKKKRTREFRCC